jgi:hypothetical protein
MRSRSKIAFDFLFLLIGVGKWVVALYLGVNLYFVFPPLFWILVFLFLGDKIIRDIYRVLKAIIKDTTIDNLKSEGEQSYIKGISEDTLLHWKFSAIAFVCSTALAVVCIIGIFHNINLWQEDGVNRFFGIAFLTAFASCCASVSVVVATRKY